MNENELLKLYGKLKENCYECTKPDNFCDNECIIGTERELVVKILNDIQNIQVSGKNTNRREELMAKYNNYNREIIFAEDGEKQLTVEINLAAKTLLWSVVWFDDTYRHFREFGDDFEAALNCFLWDEEEDGTRNIEFYTKEI